MVDRELTLKCKLKCYVKPMKDPLGVSPSKGNQGTTPSKEKILLTSVGIFSFFLSHKQEFFFPVLLSSITDTILKESFGVL